MQKIQKNSLFSILLVLIVSCNHFIEPERTINPSLTLWYDEPARDWTEALPVGNGRIGAMVYGKLGNDTIQFNEETLWSGQPHSYSRSGAHRHLPELRKLLWEGKEEEAINLAETQFTGRPDGQMSYLPFGNIILTFPGHDHASNYRRRLHLRDAVTTTVYNHNGVNYRREVFASAPAQAVIIRLEASENKALNFTASLNTPHSNNKVTINDNQIILTGNASDYPIVRDSNGYPYPKSRINFEARLKIETDGGGLITDENSVTVVSARNATLYLVSATSYASSSNIRANPSESNTENIARLEGKPYQALKEEHIADYRSLFNRVSIDLGSSDFSSRPTDERLFSFNEDEDPNLMALLFQYGRYLLISSSRSGTLAANLQGIWNQNIITSEGSRYNFNFKTQMNYWLAEATNLSECAEPLFNMIEALSESGQKTAKDHYNLNGWVTHGSTDLWSATAPAFEDGCNLQPAAGAWLAQHLWWHYQYNGNRGFLRNRAYPVLKEASQFFAHYLTSIPDNPQWLVSGPSTYPLSDKMVMGSVTDHQIIRELFSNTIEAASVLNTDEEFVNMLKLKLDSILPNQIDSVGQIITHLTEINDSATQLNILPTLWGIHPGNEIHPQTTPALAEAGKSMLIKQYENDSGWMNAWKINLWARLLEGNEAYNELKNLMGFNGNETTGLYFTRGLLFNLLHAHPTFQIDGNLGLTSGMVEMLLQSHLRDHNGNYYQDILPALPSRLRTGKISGLKGRGGFEHAITWENGRLVSLKVKSLFGNTLKLRYNGRAITRETRGGETLLFGEGDFR